MRRYLLVSLLVACAPSPSEAPAETHGKPFENRDISPTSKAPSKAPPERRIPDEVDWVGIGATAGPSATQLSIEDELLAVERRFGPERGLLFFAGGVGSRGVQASGRPERAGGHEGHDTLLLLGDLFGAVTDRRTHYRALRLSPHGPATAEAFASGLAHALGSGTRPLVVWLAGHGAEVEALSEAEVATWGGGTWSRADLEALLSASERPVRLIGTQCYGAGFAEALIARKDSCGAFAAVWTLPASGCDPSPKAARTSYGAHLLAALDTAPDLDGDGKIGLSEAHVAAVLQVDGIDVPVLSSQHLLYAEVDDAPELAPNLETEGLFEEAVIAAAIEERLGVKPAELVDAITMAHEAYEAAAREDNEAATREFEAAAVAKASILSRWPELEDPWHPDFAATLSREREAIQAHLRAAPAFEAWLVSTEARASTFDHFAHTEALLRGLVRFEIALGTMKRVALARESMPAIHERFLRLRACERAPLPMRTP